MLTPIHTIEKALAPQQRQIATHPLLSHLGDIRVLRLFMTQHVFIVWDFVNLIKALHSRLTRPSPPCIR